MAASSDRIYLYVPFEEKDRAKALGACWDAEHKCWYISRAEDHARFRQWLDEEPHPEAPGFYTIASASAYVATARARCWRCRAPISVVCLYCADGTIGGERYQDFSVSNITAIDAVLECQLKRWPYFRFIRRGGQRGCSIANHCARCGVIQQDYYLHCDPGGAFFTLKSAAPGAIEFAALVGTVRLTGDEGFEP